MRLNSSGKVVTVFLVIFVLLLISLTAISMFFFQKESKLRREVEARLAESRAYVSQMEEDLKTVKKENFVLQEKNKEADEQLSDMSDEIELEKGLREEAKQENVSLKKQLEEEVAAKKKIKEELEQQLTANEQKIIDLESRLSKEKELLKDLQAKALDFENANKTLQEKISKLEKNLSGVTTENQELSGISQTTDEAPGDVSLDKIVIAPKEVPEGRILSVDQDTDFVIINLGEKDGVSIGDLMAVYRGKDYLGDIKVTRLQPEMSAADLLPPFSSKIVRKNDQVVMK